MQRTCLDGYCNTFNSYAAMLGYHEEQSKRSLWVRSKVNDLQVEPLRKTSPLFSDLSAFAVGTTREAVDDTADNLGLAIRVDGNLYPVRTTAYKSLLERARIGGTSLSKLSKEVLAEVVNMPAWGCIRRTRCFWYVMKRSVRSIPGLRRIIRFCRSMSCLRF